MRAYSRATRTARTVCWVQCADFWLLLQTGKILLAFQYQKVGYLEVKRACVLIRKIRKKSSTDTVRRMTEPHSSTVTTSLGITGKEKRNAWKTQCREQGRKNRNHVNRKQLDSPALQTLTLFRSISYFSSQKSPPNITLSPTLFFTLYKNTSFPKTGIQLWQSLIPGSIFRMYLRKLWFYQTTRGKKKKKKTKSIFSAITAAKSFKS